MIKTKLIKTAKATILVVDGLPEDSYGHCITHIYDGHNPLVFHYGENKTGGINLPPGKWDPLNFLDKITEDEAKELVEELGKHVMLQGIFYHNYLHEESMFETATESLHSLVAANFSDFENAFLLKKID